MLHRRSFLIGAPASLLLNVGNVQAAPAIYQDIWSVPRSLSIYRAETGEYGHFEYWRDGKIQTDAWFALLHIFRDVKADLAIHYDPKVVDIVWGTQEWIARDRGGTRPFFRCTSGARSESTNRDTPGADPHSEHLKGRALDGSFEKIGRPVYAKAARFFNSGGVGLYATHVHVDSGRVRQWGF